MIYGTILRLEADSYYYCYCNKIPGCGGTHGFKDHCTVCMDEKFYCFNELNQIK